MGQRSKVENSNSVFFWGGGRLEREKIFMDGWLISPLLEPWSLGALEVGQNQLIH